MAVLLASAWLASRGGSSKGHAPADEPSAGASGDTFEASRSRRRIARSGGLEGPPGAARLPRAEVERLRAAIRAALLQTRSAAGAREANRQPEGPDGPESQEPAALDRDYIRAAIADIEPLIQECFELGRAQDPKLVHARVLVQFSIVGDEKLGGVVDDSKIDEDSSEGTNALLSQCIRETMYSLELPAPRGRGRVEVTYPFGFDAPRTVTP